MKFIPASEIISHPEHHSDCLNSVPLLVIFKDADYYKYPMLGHYIGGNLNEWRQNGSPSSWNGHILYYFPIPTIKEIINSI